MRLVEIDYLMVDYPLEPVNSAAYTKAGREAIRAQMAEIIASAHPAPNLNLTHRNAAQPGGF